MTDNARFRNYATPSAPPRLRAMSSYFLLPKLRFLSSSGSSKSSDILIRPLRQPNPVLSLRRNSRNSSLERLIPRRLNKPEHCLMASLAFCFSSSVIIRGGITAGLKVRTAGPAGTSRGTSMVSLWSAGMSTVFVTYMRKI